MNVKAFAIGVCAVACLLPALPAVAATTVYDSASFLPTPVPDRFSLYGFGRSTPSTASSARNTFAALAAAPRTSFIDIWNINVDAMPPGDYSFEAASIVATGSVLFNAITFHSINDDGSLNVISFDIDGTHTQATGGGEFGVVKPCPLKSCVWIEVTGSQIAGVPGGYSAPSFFTGPPSPVPEPETYAMLLAGLALTGAWASRRRATTA